MKCKACGEDVDELVTATVNGKTKKVCEDCKTRIDEAGEIASSAESTMQGMMEYKGRR
jgi:hypothetical protein